MTWPDARRPVRRRRALRRTGAPYGRPAILFVCTANRCRSPLAAALMRAVLPDDAAEVTAAGLLPGGEPMPEAGLKVAAEFGLDLRGHVSRRLDVGTARSADVVLTMTRHQAREVVAELPELWPRVFTAKQFTRWLTQHPPVAGLTRDWLSAEAADRSPLELLGADPADDIEDPMGKSAGTWRRVAGELLSAADQLAGALTADR
ncbi:arsenate reductase/protein-tyrosine-phosphatase family protein [Gryllotalpicola ginsengisoli]|uniref:arsenate reductase/protein-tyrosine-phosphatase family protein n=1 Tax=Gryllotalpicola ginsengisoli TaxID=444608 RepID=UPI0003B422F6|nr:protein-tyrosine-phosphatase [Gryllotalpicola ginsengisoli]